MVMTDVFRHTFKCAETYMNDFFYDAEGIRALMSHPTHVGVNREEVFLAMVMAWCIAVESLEWDFVNPEFGVSQDMFDRAVVAIRELEYTFAPTVGHYDLEQKSIQCSVHFLESEEADVSEFVSRVFNRSHMIHGPSACSWQVALLWAAYNAWMTSNGQPTITPTDQLVATEALFLWKGSTCFSELRRDLSCLTLDTVEDEVEGELPHQIALFRTYASTMRLALTLYPPARDPLGLVK